MQLRELVTQTAARFEAAQLCFGHGTTSAFDEAVYLLYSLLDMEFSEDLNAIERELDEDELQLLNSMIDARIKQHRPVAYLVNQAWFAGIPLITDERALIPRSPIAELIQNRFRPLLAEAPRRILDLCCGGGCIGIACAHAFAGARVDMADLSQDCLELARENVTLHGLDDRVRLIRADLFEGITGTYDLIVSNPPYVSAAEYAELPAEFLHEPKSGLVSEDGGLAIPIKILQQAAAHLVPEGLLVMEVGYSAAALAARLGDVPLLWLDFDNGGEGVLAITAARLRRYSDSFN